MANNEYQQATLGGGCFWCVESAFLQVKGIQSVKSGYTGGHTPNPTYEQVCTGNTGHAEVAQLQYDPEQISYRQILEIFFTLHDPTQVNRQGNDVGTQYRTSIFYHNDEQKREAEKIIAELEADGSHRVRDLLSGGGLPRKLLRQKPGKPVLSGGHFT